MMLKLVQGITIGLVVLIILAGLAIVFFKPDAIGAYVQYAPIAISTLLPEIAVAFFGKPLKEHMALQREKAKMSETTTVTTTPDKVVEKTTQTPPPVITDLPAGG